MTTITIERATVEQACEALDIAQALLEKSYHHKKILAAYEALRAALEAPATAPDELERLRTESEERLQNAVALVAEVERLRKDAERYRWLRRNPTFLGWEGDFSESYIDREVDDAISTSMKDAK